MHPLHAFTPDGTPLGTLWCQFWTRDEESLTKSAEEKRRERKAAPIEDKESLRWLEGLRQARASAQKLPGVQCACIADSEADIYEVFAEPRGEPAVHWHGRARIGMPCWNCVRSIGRCWAMPTAFTIRASTMTGCCWVVKG
jgi:hypothetical protein